MTAPYDTLIPEARAFLTELAANNTRDWFTPRKDRYDNRLRDPAQALLSDVAGDLAALTGQDVDTKLFRPHRDVRFSKDKTPYHTHLHMLWTTPGSAWFFGLSPEYVTVGGGVMGLAKDRLRAWRDLVELDGDKFTTELTALADYGFRISEPELKRVPSPFDANHPYGDLLRRKSLTVWADQSDDIDLRPAILAVFNRLQRLQSLIARLPE